MHAIFNILRDTVSSFIKREILTQMMQQNLELILEATGIYQRRKLEQDVEHLIGTMTKVFAIFTP